MENQKNKESKYVCFSCNYKTNKYSEWERHLKTGKHLKNCELDNKILKHFDITNHNENILDDKKYYLCKCGKKYLYKKGLARHIKNSNYSQTSNEKLLMQKVEELIENNIKQTKTNKQLIKKINQLDNETKENRLVTMEDSNVTNNVTNITNNYGDYQPQYITAIKDSQINMKVYLNENCSEAINLSSFIENIKLNSEDLDITRERGLAYSLGKVFLRGLKELDYKMRPICCSNSKKSILYVKDNDEWEEDKKETQIRGAIGILSVKHLTYIKEWEKANPNWDKSEKGKQLYAEMVHKILENAREEDKEKIENKVIKTIAKETLIKDMV
jgi:hypothetical protein